MMLGQLGALMLALGEYSQAETLIKEHLEIARELDLSVKTVRNHASNIFAKLHVAHRAQAIVRAREAGLG